MCSVELVIKGASVLQASVNNYSYLVTFETVKMQWNVQSGSSV
jgi:hypothetical protein